MWIGANLERRLRLRFKVPGAVQAHPPPSPHLHTQGPPDHALYNFNGNCIGLDVDVTPGIPAADAPVTIVLSLSIDLATTSEPPVGPRLHPTPPHHLCGVLSLPVSGFVSDPAH